MYPAFRQKDPTNDGGEEERSQNCELPLIRARLGTFQRHIISTNLLLQSETVTEGMGLHFHSFGHDGESILIDKVP